MTTLHEACYRGSVDVVRALLASGADANATAATPHPWISAAGDRVKPLNCVAIARAVTKDHIEIARLLLAHGAIVDPSVRDDLAAESIGGPEDQALAALLGVR